MYIMVSDLLHNVHPTDRWLESLIQGIRDTVDMAKPDGPWNLNMPQLDIVMLTISICESYVNYVWTYDVMRYQYMCHDMDNS